MDQHSPPTILRFRQTQQFTHYLCPRANHRASHRQTHTITEITSPHPESTNKCSIYLYTHCTIVQFAQCIVQFAQCSWCLNFVDPLAGLCVAWWLSTFYTSIFMVQSMYSHKQLFVYWAYGRGRLKERKKRRGLVYTKSGTQQDKYSLSGLPQKPPLKQCKHWRWLNSRID